MSESTDKALAALGQHDADAAMIDELWQIVAELCDREHTVWQLIHLEHKQEQASWKQCKFCSPRYAEYHARVAARMGG